MKDLLKIILWFVGVLLAIAAVNGLSYLLLGDTVVARIVGVIGTLAIVPILRIPIIRMASDINTDDKPKEQKPNKFQERTSLTRRRSE